MRVISQGGTIDIPYDYFSLCMACARIESGKVEDRNVFSIVCHNLSSPNGTKLAEYSTKEKALKAMEMLRESDTEVSSFISDYSGVKSTVSNRKYFQFPAEEELE